MNKIKAGRETQCCTLSAAMSSLRKCASCEKTVYPNDEQMIAEGGIFHRTCFKCNHASAHQLTL